MALLIMGCGGGSDSAMLTKGQFVKQGNSICEKAEKERFAIFQQKTEELSPKDQKQKATQEEVLLSAMRSYEKATESLSELAPPAAEEEKVESLIDAMEETLQRIEQDPGTVLVSDAPFTEPNEQAKKLGLTDCVT